MYLLPIFLYYLNNYINIINIILFKNILDFFQHFLNKNMELQK